MSQFNKSSKGLDNISDIRNAAGGLAFSRTKCEELVSIVMNAMIINEKKFYASDIMKDVENIIDNMNDAELKFAAKLMVYIRTKGYLRSISHCLAVLLAERVKGKSFMSKAYFQAIVRPDDMTEIVALWNSRNSRNSRTSSSQSNKSKMIPNALRRAMKKSLEQTFDAYQLKKYEGNGNVIKLKNIVLLTHPSPKNFEDKNIFKKLIEGNLDNIQTIERSLAGGQNAADSFKELLTNRKLGYMAAVKNIKNALNSELDDEGVKLWINLITNKTMIERSKMLPFRFYDAYRMIETECPTVNEFKKKHVINALQIAFSHSAKNTNLVNEGERVALMLDESYSMNGNPFERGKILMSSLASGLNVEDTVSYLWADSGKTRKIDIDAKQPFDFVQRTRCSGGGTDVYSAVEKLQQTNTAVDVMIIFTDEQLYDTRNMWFVDERRFTDCINTYRKIAPGCKVVFWNMNTYGGGTPCKMKNNIFDISGYSDKIIEMLPHILDGGTTLVKEIEKIEI